MPRPMSRRVTERVSLQGRAVGEAALARALTRALDAYEAARGAGTAAAEATWFDCLTAAAFLIFRDAGVEWAVVEVGLGGRLDSTNVVNGEIAVVTNIGLEHTEILGKTRALIAGEKVGILKPGAVLVTTLGPRDEAGRVLHARARALGAPVVLARAGKAATIDATNVAVAGAVLDELGKKNVLGRDGRPLGAALIDAKTRAAARLVGRMERVDMDLGAARLPVVFDGAHVPFNLAAVLRDLARFPDLAGPCVAVVALASDKDAAGFLSELKARASAVVLHRGALREPWPARRRACRPRVLARPQGHGRARARARLPARRRARSRSERVAPGHRLALSRRGAAPRGGRAMRIYRQTLLPFTGEGGRRSRPDEGRAAAGQTISAFAS